MNCMDVKNLVTIGIYGRLTDEQAENLARHCEDCPSCAALLNRSERLFQAGGSRFEPPLPDWDKHWDIIADRSLGRRRRLPTLPVPGWAAAVSAVALVFILGYFAGRTLFKPVPGIPVAQTGADRMHELSWTGYFSDLEPLLVNFLNRGADGAEIPDRLKQLENRILQDLLVRTRLLKRSAADSGSRELRELIQDLEFILTALVNLKPEDPESAGHLARLIRDMDFALRMKQLGAADITL